MNLCNWFSYACAANTCDWPVVLGREHLRWLDWFDHFAEVDGVAVAKHPHPNEI